MDRRQLAFVASHLIERIRKFPDAALDELFASMDEIERQYDLLEKLTQEEIQAIEQSRLEMDRGESISFEEIRAKFGLDDFDADAEGKADFDEAASRVKKLGGEEQAEISDVLFVLLNEQRDDVPPLPI